MTRRRHSWVGTSLAAAAAVAAALLASLAAPAPASAAPGHVAIVIAGDKSACVAWKPGMTGDSLLREVASVSYQKSTGFISQIDGKPADGVSTISKYWSYWHRTTGGWAYSQQAASGYSVPAGSVEGWVFGNGSAPPAGAYSTICVGADSATPASSKPATQAAAATTAAPSQASSHSSAGTIAGISIAVLAVLGLGGAAVWQQRRRRG